MRDRPIVNQMPASVFDDSESLVDFTHQKKSRVRSDLGSGKIKRDALFLVDQGFYNQHNVDLVLANRAEGIDTSNQRVHLAGGQKIAYDDLLVAIGSSAKSLDVEGANLPGVYSLKTVDDGDALVANSTKMEKIVIFWVCWCAIAFITNFSPSGDHGKNHQAIPILEWFVFFVNLMSIQQNQTMSLKVHAGMIGKKFEYCGVFRHGHIKQFPDRNMSNITFEAGMNSEFENNH